MQENLIFQNDRVSYTGKSRILALMFVIGMLRHLLMLRVVSLEIIDENSLNIVIREI